MIKIEAVGQKVIEEIQTSLTTGDSSILTKMDEMNKNIDKVAKQVTKLGTLMGPLSRDGIQRK